MKTSLTSLASVCAPGGRWLPLAAITLWGTASPVLAAPARGPMGPSAKAAARLKEKPSTNWMAHYLPEDRYKFGAAWQFVTTNLDTYYHRPHCPSMLRQSADNVSGFATVREAEEAGYAPDRSCVNAPLALGAGGSGMREVNAPLTGTMALANGAMKLTLPAGWKRTKSQEGDFLGMAISNHVITDGKGGRLELHLMDMGQFIQNMRARNPNVKVPDFGQYTRAARIKESQGPWGQRLSNFQNSGTISSSSNQFFANMQQLNRASKVVDRAIGGWNGVLMTFTNGPEGVRRTYTAGKGTKIFSLADYTGRGDAAESLIKSLKLAN